MIELLGWTGMLLGVLGSALLAANLKCSRYGFGIFVISNLCLMGYTWQRVTYPLLTLYTVLLIVSVFGVARWFGRTVWRRPSPRVRCMVGSYERVAVVAREARCRSRGNLA